MSLPWFRLYTEFASDPKVQILAFEDQRHFVMCLCLKGSGVIDTKASDSSYRERLIAKALGLDIESSKEAKRRLVEAGLIDKHWHPLKWESRQFQSDYSTLRVRKHREKREGNVTETFQKRSETVQDQIQNRTDTNQNLKRAIKLPISSEKPQESPSERREAQEALARIRERIAK
jgi:hypothetical protein